MKHYPILFTFRDKVFGNGFLADVTVHGRALAVEEEDGWWMCGVEPGDLAAGGVTLTEALAEFRKTFTTILFDIAEEVQDHESFEVEVGDFFGGVNHPTEEEWKIALAEVRSGRTVAEAILDGLPIKPADSPRFAEIRIMDSYTSKDNVQDAQIAVAA